MADEQDHRLAAMYDRYVREGAGSEDWQGLADDAITQVGILTDTLRTLMTVLVRRG